MLKKEQWGIALNNYFNRTGNIEIIFLGSESDFETAEDIIQYCRTLSDRPTYINHCGKLTFNQSIAFLATSDEFIGIDSGLLHFARILGVQCTSFWGPTDPATRLKPFPGLIESIYYRKVPCSPCVHVSEVPPCNGENICISCLYDNPNTCFSSLEVTAVINGNKESYLKLGKSR
ncbi:ADP-heptose:LPS heptosyltransferase II [Geobacter sp. OR-1]|uniref:glycosyltransferase family 9 protein n=1 Tax=Geobacter sp. OR-1 TaxID=1266765 RepID=UPI0005423C7B|nr:ADP-heptose:LPS heptosyltransferase II [Geobacter sp. OR-1]